jgi:tetratricopeptide (TPR) repeat protein
MPESPPPNTDAYRLYLRGRYFWNQLTVEGCEKALKFFERAIAIDPGYARAYAALADDYHWLILFGVCNPNRLASLTRRLSLKALQLDRNCAEAYISLATGTAALDWQWEEAELLFRRGLELRPNYVLGYILRAFCRLQKGDREGSRADVEKALDLDPLSPRSHRVAAVCLSILRDYEAALIAFDRAVELGPEIKNTHYYRGLALLQAGRYDEAVAAISDSLEPSTTAANLGALVAAYAAAGQKRKAEESLHRLHNISNRSFAPPMSFVYAYTGLGRRAEALDWLERAVQERSAFTILLPPLAENLGREPRFQALLQLMNLSQ